MLQSLSFDSLSCLRCQNPFVSDKKSSKCPVVSAGCGHAVCAGCFKEIQTKLKDEASSFSCPKCGDHSPWTKSEKCQRYHTLIDVIKELNEGNVKVKHDVVGGRLYEWIDVSTVKSLSCPICLQTYVGESGRASSPEYFLCGHSTCRDCVGELKKDKTNKVSCPLCGVATHFDIDEKNVLTDVVADLQKRRLVEFDLHKCATCVKKERAERVWTCENCDVKPLCGYCAHRDHRDHETVECFPNSIKEYAVALEKAFVSKTEDLEKDVAQTMTKLYDHFRNTVRTAYKRSIDKDDAVDYHRATKRLCQRIEEMEHIHRECMQIYAEDIMTTINDLEEPVVQEEP